MPSTKTPSLPHAKGCPASRIEQPHADRPHHLRCCDCGGSSVPDPASTGPFSGITVDPAGGVTMRPMPDPTGGTL